MAGPKTELPSPDLTARPHRPDRPLDPIAAAVTAAFSVPPLSSQPIDQTRAALKAAATVETGPALAEVSDHRVATTGGEPVALRLYTLESAADRLLILAHGGGFALGSIPEIDRFARHLAARTGCLAASVEYRLAPEHRFPAAPSLRHFDPPFMSTDDVAWFISMYLPGPEAMDHPDFAPIRARDLGVLPPAQIICAEHDILTEQGLAYADRLRDCGVTVETACIPGIIHGFLTLDAFLDGAALDAIDLIGRFILRHDG